LRGGEHDGEGGAESGPHEESSDPAKLIEAALALLKDGAAKKE